MWWLPASPTLAQEENWEDSLMQILHQDIGVTYKNPERALQSALEALEENNEPNLENKSTESLTLYLLNAARVARIYEQMKHYEEALVYYIKSLETAEVIHFKDVHLLHSKLVNVNEQLDHFREAYHHALLHKSLKDSLFEIEKDKSLEELQTRYLAREKQATIDSLEIEKEYMSLKNEEEATFRKIVIIAAIILLLPTLVLLIIYTQKLKSERQLAIIKEEANQHRAAEQERMLELESIKTSIEAKEEERKRIASELHDNIAGTLAGIKHSLSKMIKNKDKQNLSRLIQNIDATYQEVRTLSHHLVPPSMLTKDFLLVLEKYLHEISKIHDMKMTLSLFPENYFNRLSEEIQTEIYRITQECINNIVKHADARHVDISFTCHEDNISLMIEDDGIGFDPARNNEGKGLSNIRSRIELMKGELDVDSVTGRGTVISAVFPIGDLLQVPIN